MTAPTATGPARSTYGRRAGNAGAGVLAGIVALNLLAAGVDHAVGRDPSGVAGSSFGTQDAGLAALAALVAHFDHPVERQRGALTTSVLDPASTLFVIEPQTLTAADDARLLEFVTAGGRLVIGGSDPFYLHNLRDRPPAWAATGSTTYDRIDPSLGGARNVAAAGQGSWADHGSGVVLARSGGTVLVTADRVGRGAVLFLADASPLENAYLGEADNAAFALGLAGAPGRPLVFAEGTHGYGRRRGLGAIPSPWKLALVILVAAAVVIAWSRGRRFGPPDRPAREMHPARAEYVRALAGSLERTRDPAAALAPMQAWARSEIGRRAHLPADATLEQTDRAAIRLGLSDADRAALWHPPTDDESALALGRLASRLSQREGTTS